MSMANILGFSAPAEIEIVFDNEDQREHAKVKTGKSSYKNYPVYIDEESVKGKITVRPKSGRKLEHGGIKIELIGSIELFKNRGKDFVTLSQEVAAPSEIQQATSYIFVFKNVEKQYESHSGINVRLRYFVRVTIVRRVADIVHERDFRVFSYRMPTEDSSSIKMEVGIEDSLHLEFEYNKSKYNLQEAIVGRVYFLLVRIKIKSMELSVIQRETIGSEDDVYNERKNVTKFEIMDGAPMRGEVIPIRLFLGMCDLTPTFREVNKRFSTRYYLNLVLTDEENRRYFKQQEITLYRKKGNGRSSLDVALRY